VSSGVFCIPPQMLCPVMSGIGVEFA